ncbi:MAG TPA: ferredoxin [Acidimicrobiales bacterium]|nr:ferredoxin [Acidimicrobiales bacterium]
MRIEFDREACTGHGRCYTLAPEVYESDDVGYCDDPTGEVPVGLEEAARRGAANCPEGAITIVED